MPAKVIEQLLIIPCIGNEQAHNLGHFPLGGLGWVICNAGDCQALIAEHCLQKAVQKLQKVCGSDTQGLKLLRNQRALHDGSQTLIHLAYQHGLCKDPWTQRKTC